MVLVFCVGTKGVNKLTRVLNSASPSAIILCEGSRLISLRIQLAEYPQWVWRSPCIKSFLEHLGPFLF